ncbi:hypothetical protein SCLCIDRAFT_1216819 [Scleroderma citrinum Foug A]|uniref:Uncharacterized protein n=1 Tax=Scleroderma citrinum Foug A TaxID=1036808 RepID=A0A0C3DIM8_9AGAM|nr:hypothetical protein SCLCIDRAFT_1216819 [Scleroderma citrinum Foug A]
MCISIGVSSQSQVDLAAAAKIPVDISEAWDNKVRDGTVRICVLRLGICTGEDIGSG